MWPSGTWFSRIPLKELTKMRKVFSKLPQIYKPRKPKMQVRTTTIKFMPTKKLLQTSDTIRAVKYS